MRVLHIGKFFPPAPGGMENFLRDLLGDLARNGIECHALVHNHQRSWHAVTETVNIGRAAVRVTRAPLLAQAFFTPISPGFRGLLDSLIVELKPDILHLHVPNPSAFWVMSLKSARRIPWIVQWQADVLASRHDWRLQFAYRFYRPLETRLLAGSAAIITSSRPYLEHSAALAPWTDKCRVIPLGLDPSRLESAEEASPLNATSYWRGGGLRVLAVGRLTYYKGFRYLLRAAAQTRKVQVCLVGDGEQAGELRQLAMRLGLADRVIMPGFLPNSELAALFRSCDCLCLPSIERTESFGIVLLEAMYHGKAAVVSNVTGSGMGWVVEDEETGLHVPPGTSEHLAAALDRLADDRALCRILGIRGRERFDKIFSLDRVSHQVAALYSQLAGSHDQSRGTWC